MTRRSMEVLAAGPLTTVQDRGRPGRSAWGVGRSGAADRWAAALANRLVANPPQAALFEVTMGQLAVRARAALTVALTGALAPADVDGVPVPFGAPLALPAGAVLRLGVPDAGLRTYLAVRGGVDVPAVLGSRSSDLLARLGPDPVRSGDVVPVGPEPVDWPAVDITPTLNQRPSGRAPWTVHSSARRTELGWLPGAHVGAVPDSALSGLPAHDWLVGADSDRTALRLTGPTLPRSTQDDSPPEGLVRGAIQLPPSGQPVVMLADHPVTGGYPAIGALDDVSCDLAAQLRPGDRVRLVQLRW